MLVLFLGSDEALKNDVVYVVLKCRDVVFKVIEVLMK